MKYSKEVQQFYKKHPEFNNCERNLVTSFPSYQRNMNERRLIEANLILEHLEFYPDEKVKKVMHMYFEGEPISAIARFIKRTKKQTSRYLFSLRHKLLKFAKEGERIELKGKKVHRTVTLMHKGKIAEVFLINSKKGELLWVRSDGLILPDEVQDLLG